MNYGIIAKFYLFIKYTYFHVHEIVDVNLPGVIDDFCQVIFSCVLVELKHESSCPACDVTLNDSLTYNRP